MNLGDRFNFRIWNGHSFIYSKDLAYDGLEQKTKNYQMFKKLFKLFYMPISMGNCEECIIQQSTGFVDENNKEIYEGDYISTNEQAITVAIGGFPVYSCGQIMYYKSGFHVCQKLIGGNPFGDLTSCDCCPIYGAAVIGNIFESN